MSARADRRGRDGAADRTMASLRELSTMPLSADAFASVRAGLRDARRALEAQLILARDDEPDVRARRFGIIRTSLAELAESEARLDMAERTLAASLYARR
jgi:hypothetical protein